MTILRAYLFQTLRLTDHEGRSLDMGSPTTRSLLAYLLLHRSQPSDRRRLAFLFWPRGTESAARRNLRQYLHRIRKMLESLEFEGELIQTTGTVVQINPQAKIWLDVDIFQAKARPDVSLEDRQAAIQLYVGDLLDDIYEDWCLDERRQFRLIYLQTLDALSEQLQAEQQVDGALVAAQKWLVAEPLDEAAHRRLMSIYAQMGNRNRALQHFQELKVMLAQELNAEPLPETQHLVDAIQTGPPNGAQPTHPVVSHQPEPVLAAPPALPLVGRQHELDLIQAAWKQAHHGQGSFILLTGDSGIGKTRVIQEYLAVNTAVPKLHTLCHELEAMAAYAPLRRLLLMALNQLPQNALQAMYPWLNALTPILPDLRQQFPTLPTWQPNRPEQIHTTEAITHLLLMLTKQASDETRPLLLVLDDLHWADNSTWEFLRYLVHNIASIPFLVIGSCRLEDLPPEQDKLIRSLKRVDMFLHLPLQRLSLSESTQLAQHLFENTFPEALFFQQLYHETEGNPFFIIEVIRSLQERDQPARLPFGAGQERAVKNLPGPILSLIEARLDRLTLRSQELLAIAAAIGQAFSLALLEDISQAPVEEVIAAIETWLQKGLVLEDADGYNFSHDKIRQVAYASLSRARRQYVHRCLAEAFENAILSVDAATLAHHYARSDQAIKALPYLTEAGEQALRVHSYHEARQFGLQAVSLLGRQAGPRRRQERIDLNLQLAQAYAFSGDLARAVEIIEQAEQLAMHIQDEQRLGKIFRRAAQIFWLRGQSKTAGDYARRALRSAEELEDLSLLRAALRMLGRVSIALAAFDDAIAYLLRYINLETPESTHKHPNLPVVYGYLGIAYARVGSWQRALDAAQQGVDLAQEQGVVGTVAFALAPLAFVHAAQRQWKACAQTLEEVPMLHKSNREFTPLAFMVFGLHGYTLAQLGETAEGVRIISEALNWLDDNDYRVFHYLPRVFLAESLFLHGEINAAKVEAQQALDSARVSGNRWVVGIALRGLADICIRDTAPDWPQIERYLIESMQTLRQIRARPDLARTYLALRRLYDRAGQIAWAVDCHFRATSIFDELDMADELRLAQGQAGGERRGAVVIHDMGLRGPNTGTDESSSAESA